MFSPLDFCSCITCIHCDNRYSAATFRVSIQSLRFWLKKFVLLFHLFKLFQLIHRDCIILQASILGDGLFDAYTLLKHKLSIWKTYASIHSCFQTSAYSWWRRGESNPRPKRSNHSIYARVPCFILAHPTAHRQAIVCASGHGCVACAPATQTHASLLNDTSPPSRRQRFRVTAILSRESQFRVGGLVFR